jgi:fatty acid desaturase
VPAAIPADKRYLESFDALRTEFGRRGFFERDTARIIGQLLLHVGTAVAGLALFVSSESPPVRAVATLLWATGLLGIGTNAHTASHYATSRRRWVNEALVFLGYPVTLGFSATYWWHKHVAVHHKNPNIVGLDDDIDLMPFFAITDMDRDRATGIARRYYALQWLLLPIALGLNGYNVQRQGALHLLRALGDPTRRRAAHWIDLGCHAAHVVLWLGLPMLLFAPPQVVAFYLFRNAIMGYALFVAFAPAHFPAEATCSLDGGEGTPFALRQTAASLDFRTGPVGRLVCSGVEYQIEHHLFSGMSHTRYPEASRLVEEFCAHHGYPYRRLGWLEALGKSLAVFVEPKRVAPPLRSSRDLRAA